MKNLIIFTLIYHYSQAIKMVDLTHKVSADFTIAWPGQPGFEVTNEFQNEKYKTRDFAQTEHCGTHTDAPSHFVPKTGRDLGDFTLDELVGPGIVVDVKRKVQEDPDYQLQISDLKDWEEMHGRIPDRAVVLMNSGNHQFYHQKAKYLGYPEGQEGVEFLHFPGFHPEATKWLVEERSIIGVGLDTPSTDRGQSKDFQTHVNLGNGDKWGLENAANLNELPPKGFTVYNMVYKLEGGSGGPSRVFAIIGDNNGSTASGIIKSLILISTLLNILFR